jgi:hypothetical protein
MSDAANVANVGAAMQSELCTLVDGHSAQLKQVIARRSSEMMTAAHQVQPERIRELEKSLQSAVEAAHKVEIDLRQSQSQLAEVTSAHAQRVRELELRMAEGDGRLAKLQAECRRLEDALVAAEAKDKCLQSTYAEVESRHRSEMANRVAAAKVQLEAELNGSKETIRVLESALAADRAALTSERSARALTVENARLTAGQHSATQVQNLETELKQAREGLHRAQLETQRAKAEVMSQLQNLETELKQAREGLHRAQLESQRVKAEVATQVRELEQRVSTQSELHASEVRRLQSMADASKERIATMIRDHEDQFQQHEKLAEVECSRLQSRLTTAREATEAARREGKLSLDNAKLEAAATIQKTIIEAETRANAQNKNLAESVRQLTEDLHCKQAVLDTLRKQIETLKTLTTTHMPADLGNAGEVHIQTFLEQAFANFLHVRNVSKIGQGHELDLELISRDKSVRIRIDVKNAKNVPEHEVARFHSDVDGIQPPLAGAILFMKCELAGTDCITKYNRGSTIICQVGRWARDCLIGCIIDIVVAHRLTKTTSVGNATRDLSFGGSDQVTKALSGLCGLVRFQNERAANADAMIHDWTGRGAQYNRDVRELLRAAHDANPTVVPKKMLTEFEDDVPKRRRGGKHRSLIIGNEPKPRQRPRNKPTTKDQPATPTGILSKPSHQTQATGDTASETARSQAASAATKPRVAPGKHARDPSQTSLKSILEALNQRSQRPVKRPKS